MKNLHIELYNKRENLEVMARQARTRNRANAAAARRRADQLLTSRACSKRDSLLI